MDLIYRTNFTPNLDERPLSYSALKAFAKSPQHYLEYIFGKRKESAAMAFGTLVDVLILTPDDFERRFVIAPEMDRRTTEGKAKYLQFTEANKGKTYVSADDLELAKHLKMKANENKKTKELLSRVGDVQKKINWIESDSELPFVGFIDMIGDTFIADLKTATDGSPDTFMRSAYDLGYHIQAAAYLDAMVKNRGKYYDYFFLVLETSVPYNISVFKATNDFLKIGKESYQSLAMEFKFCKENNLWHQGYEFHSATGYHQLDLPGWAKFKKR